MSEPRKTLAPYTLRGALYLVSRLATTMTRVLDQTDPDERNALTLDLIKRAASIGEDAGAGMIQGMRDGLTKR